LRNSALLCIAFWLYLLPLHAMPNDDVLKKMIGHMLIVGFDEESLTNTSPIIEEIERYELGGVILFDRFYSDKTHVKNIRSSTQLRNLTHTLNTSAKNPLLICVDQEGGNVARLKPSAGFIQTPSAHKVAQDSLQNAVVTYHSMAQMLFSHGINCNFAPDVDLARNPKNSVIVGLERSYGSDVNVVSAYASTFIDALSSYHIVSVLKHFPGHGSSLGDSHLGFVDVSQTWNEIELEPYKRLIDKNKVAMIMSAHVFNAHLDAHYPATLSYAINTTLLREKLGFQGVLVSDDMQMQAIANHYTLKEALSLAINSGIDMLLFGNQLSKTQTSEIVEIIFSHVKSGVIAWKRIEEANERIQKNRR
jgi:beta-N-acetylhexosaminidase